MMLNTNKHMTKKEFCELYNLSGTEYVIIEKGKLHIFNDEADAGNKIFRFVNRKFFLNKGYNFTEKQIEALYTPDIGRRAINEFTLGLNEFDGDEEKDIRAQNPQAIDLKKTSLEDNIFWIRVFWDETSFLDKSLLSDLEVVDYRNSPQKKKNQAL